MSDASSTHAPDPAAGDARVAVLVVVREPDEQSRTVSALGLRADLDVTSVGSIAEAREHLADTDILVVDGDLRPKGGYSWLYELRGEAELVGGQRPPAVVLTDRDQDTFLVEWAHAERAVTKPVDPFTLARAVAELAGRRTAS